MSEPNSDRNPKKHTYNNNGYSMLKGKYSFLLQPEPEAMLTVELVDKPVQLPHEQFEALLIDSECEV